MRWNHLFKEAVGLGFLGMLLPCAGVAAAADDDAHSAPGTVQVESTNGKATATTGTLQLKRDGGVLQLIVNDAQSTDDKTDGKTENTQTHSKLWIGVGCQTVPAAIRAQLDLPQGQGLFVEQVVADGPAAKAGIKEYDILLTADEASLAEPSDLVKAVDAAHDKSVSLQLLRGGKAQTVAVTPSERPHDERGMPHRGPEQEAWQKWLEQMPKMPGMAGPMQFRVFNAPGMVVRSGGGGDNMMFHYQRGGQLPDNTTVTITRKGKDPAKISVKQGDESWEVSEEELDKLPSKVRELVQPMVGGPDTFRFQAKAIPMPGGFPGMGGGMGGAMAGGPMPPGGRPPHALTDGKDGDDRLEGRLEDLGRQMDELRDAIRDLRDQRAHHEAPPPRPGTQE